MNKSKTEKETHPIYSCIVIGAGISGISFAHKLAQKGEDILVLEKEKSAGGQVNTRFSQNRHDFWVEAGAHTCYNSYTHLLSLAEEINYTDSILPLQRLKYLIYTDNQIKSPFSSVAFLPMMFHGWRCFFSSKAGKTVEEYFKPIVGASNYKKLFTYMFRAVICQKADEYPAEVFLKRRKDRRKDIYRKFSFKNGLSGLIEEIIRANGIPVKTETDITGIEYTDGLFEIKTSTGETYLSKNIAIATHAAQAAGLMKNIDPETAGILKEIMTSGSETLTMIIESDKLTTPLVAGVIPTSDEFHSVVSVDVAGKTGLRGFSFHFGKGVKSNEEKIATACKVLGILPEDILEHSFCSHILPALRTKNLGLIEKINQARSNPHVYLTGNYFYGVSMEDCVQRSLEEAERYFI